MVQSELCCLPGPVVQSELCCLPGPVVQSELCCLLGPVVQSESRAASPLSGEDCMPEEEVPVDTVDTADLVVPCYLLMLDVLLKQVSNNILRLENGHTVSASGLNHLI